MPPIDTDSMTFGSLLSRDERPLQLPPVTLTPMQAIQQRHSVRHFNEERLGDDVASALESAIDAVNEQGEIDIQLVTDEPEAFKSLKSRFVGFSGVRNYIAMAGPEYKNLDWLLGYYGEQLVLFAQAMGLRTCWVGGTYKMVTRGPRVDLGEKLAAVVAIGYSDEDGKPHDSKPPEAVSPDYAHAPEWFKSGVDAALLAPTALNQQKFSFALEEGAEGGLPVVHARTKRGAFAQMDLGIVTCHFEIGAGPEPFRWG